MRRASLILAATMVLAAGCGGTAGGSGTADGGGSGSDPSAAADPNPTPTSFADQPVRVAVTSYDLAVGEDRRFTAGLVLSDEGVLVGGEVTMKLFYLDEQAAEDGAEDGAGNARSSDEALAESTARFVPVPGLGPEEPLEEPEPGDGAIVGVYETTFDFEQPGRYGVGVVADIDGQPLQGTTTFEVAAETKVPAVGDPAPLEPNPTMDSGAVPGIIDSRARDGGDVPDPQLHQTTLADALEAGRRAVVVVSTPVYCVSRFCGPITEEVARMADDFGEDTAVIHIEVWEDFEEQQLNPAAAAWIQTEEGGNEPWLFVVDRDGTVMGRWDNVVDLSAVQALLDAGAGENS